MANKPLAALHPEWQIAVDEARENRAALGLDSLQSTRPVHADADTPAQIDEAFDVIAYQKGASVLRMVESYVGADSFRKGINAYLQTHQHGNATSEDFWKAISSSSGKPVERMLPTFVNQPGVPLLTVTLACPGSQETSVTIGQSRFLADGSSPSDRELWQVPFCFESAASKRAPNPAAGRQCFVLTGQQHDYTIHDGGCQRWVFANLDARGYYRTEYAPELLRAMTPDVETKLTAPERLSLVDDEWAMVKAGRHSIADYLSLVAGFGREHTSGVLGDITGRLRGIKEDLVTDATRPAFEAFVRSLLRPLYDEVGIAPSASDLRGGEDDSRRELRAVVVSALGGIGSEPDVAAKARSAVDGALEGREPLEPTLADALVSIAAAHGDAKLFDALLAAAEKATSPDERYRYLYALADFTDPGLIDRGLALVTTDRVRTQDASIYLAQFLIRPSSRERAWTFLTERWDAVAPKVTISGGDTNLVQATGAFCDARSKDRVASFFAAHPLPAAARALTQAQEQIANCVRLRESQAPKLAEWLGRR
jgi:aminopeptidase N